MTVLANFMMVTLANQKRGHMVGNSKLMEMIAAIDTNFLAFQPACIPTDWQASQIAHKEFASPHTVHLIADDTFDLGN